MSVIDTRYDKRKDRGVMFFSSSNFRDTMYLLKNKIYELLVSYHYIRKNKANYETLVIPEIRAHDGLFMTDSGVYSFFNALDREDPKYYQPSFWVPFIEEYVQWVEQWHKDIYCCANFDLDLIVGREQVRAWNKKYFEPLEKLTQVIYVAHHTEDSEDRTGLKHFEEYCRKYQYVGVNQFLKPHAAQLYAIAKRYKRRVHGFAWTSIPLLRSYPWASTDSTSWLGGLRYGTSYIYDGKNTHVEDYKKKYLRKPTFQRVKKLGIDMGKLMGDDKEAVTAFNLEGWKGFRKEYIRVANLKLTSFPPAAYKK